VERLSARVFPHGVPQPKDIRTLYIGEADAHLIEAATRLMELMGRPADAELIAPLVIEEILIRLLRSPMGGRIAQMGQVDSSLHRVASAVSWLRKHYDQPVDVEAGETGEHERLHAFHRQFRAVTSMSPLQFQKALRSRKRGA
jgi:hypothetical protein